MLPRLSVQGTKSMYAREPFRLHLRSSSLANAHRLAAHLDRTDAPHLAQASGRDGYGRFPEQDKIYEISSQDNVIGKAITQR